MREFEDVEAYSEALGCPISDAELKGRSERVRGRDVLAGSIITGVSSLLSAPAVGDWHWRVDKGFSSFSLTPSNLLDFRDWWECLEEDGDVIDDSGGEVDEPLSRLLALGLPLEGSAVDFERSRVPVHRGRLVIFPPTILPYTLPLLSSALCIPCSRLPHNPP
jgi:hypothetical protein